MEHFGSRSWTVIFLSAEGGQHLKCPPMKSSRKLDFCDINQVFANVPRNVKWCFSKEEKMSEMGPKNLKNPKIHKKLKFLDFLDFYDSFLKWPTNILSPF